MCLAVPARVETIDDATGMATAVVDGRARPLNLAMTPQVREGDWVLFHAGFAVRRIDPGEADAILDLLHEAFPGT